jgi:hypothetical protein
MKPSAVKFLDVITKEYLDRHTPIPLHGILEATGTVPVDARGKVSVADEALLSRRAAFAVTASATAGDYLLASNVDDEKACRDAAPGCLSVQFPFEFAQGRGFVQVTLPRKIEVDVHRKNLGTGVGAIEISFIFKDGVRMFITGGNPSIPIRGHFLLTAIGVSSSALTYNLQPERGGDDWQVKLALEGGC